jgi:hypothetical protein
MKCGADLYLPWTSIHQQYHPRSVQKPEKLVSSSVERVILDSGCVLYRLHRDAAHNQTSSRGSARPVNLAIKINVPV